MNQDLFKRNLDLLRQIGYDEELFTENSLEIEKTKDELDTIKYTLEDSRSIYIHSKYNTQREIEAILKDIDITKDCLYIVYGLGLGHHIKELKKRISKESVIFVIEKNKDIITSYMKNKDFLELLMGQVYFFFGDEKDILVRFNNVIYVMHIMVKAVNLQVIVPPAYTHIYGQWINVFTEQLVDSTENAYFSIGNDMQDTINGIENNFENIYELIKSPSIESLKGVYRDTPVIIVGAGPSLDKNIEKLKKAQGKALIFATDAALTSLRNHKIIPDAVFSIERVWETYEAFYKDKRVDKDVVLIGPPVIRKEILETLEENKKLLCLKHGESINTWMNDSILKENRLLRMGTSCSHIAMSFAQHIDANPIISIGQDMAFTKDGVTHSEDVEVKEKVNTNNHREKIYFVKGIDGNMLPTLEAYKNFLTWIEIEVARDKKDRLYIDATEGGAYKNGMVYITLEEAINKYCNKKVDKLCNHVPEGEFSVEKYITAINELQAVENNFNDLRNLAEKQLNRLEKIEKLINKKVLNENQAIKAVKTLSKIKSIEKAIVADGILRLFFQGLFITSAAQNKKLGNVFNESIINKNFYIQKKLVEGIIGGCEKTIEKIKEIITDLKDSDYYRKSETV